jgi:putative DNA primase/helicase
MTSVLEAVLAFSEAGCSVIPAAADGTKAPWPDGAQWKHYQSERPSKTQLREWFDGGRYDGFGLVCGQVSGGLEMLELEGRAVSEGMIAAFTGAITDHGLGELWKKVTAGYTETTPSGGLHILYRAAGRARASRKLARRPATPAELAADPGDKLKVLIETRGEGGFTIVAPSGRRTHPSGKPWQLASGGPATIAVITEDERDALHAIASLLTAEPPRFRRPAAAAAGDFAAEGQDRPGDDYATRTGWAEILEPHGWRLVCSYGSGRHGWRRPGKTRGVSATTRDDGGFYVFSTSTQFEDLVPYGKFGVYTELNHSGDYRAAASQLRREGYGASRPPEPRGHRPPADGSPVTDELPFPRTQLDWGLRFAASRTWLRHVHGIGWHTWDGKRWKPDADGEAGRAYADMIKDGYPELAAVSSDDDRKRAFRDLLAAEKKSFAEGALWFASCRPEMTVAASTLDAGRMLLNCANGTLHLDTMQLRPHDMASSITKVCTGAWIPELGETRWSKFVTEILPDPAIRGFTQRLMGSALAGRVREHVLPILTGTGGNGKSTFIEAILHALGDYGMQADPTLLMASRHDAHPTGQAALQSRRLAVCTETAHGRHLDAPTAKQLTGGDTITARYMRKDFFSFEPSHTILMVTNHKPVVDGNDDALWRRLVVVPFGQVFSRDQADPDLKKQLESEPDAILSWMIGGWLEYQQRGLQIPDSVRAATEAYKTDSDAVGRFIGERFYKTDFGSEISSAVFAAWQQWCVTNGEETGTQKAFSEELARRGYRKTRQGRGMVWHGFMLLNGENDEPVQGSEGAAGSPHTRAYVAGHTAAPTSPCTPQEPFAWPDGSIGERP